MIIKKQGFTFAELLISLMIIGVVIAASAPVVLRGQTTVPEKIWNWSKNNTAIYFGENQNQKVIIGHNSIPVPAPNTLEEDVNGGTVEFNGKLVVSARENKSIFDFYSHPGELFSQKQAKIANDNNENDDSCVIEPPRGINYGGRIAGGFNNLAFGIGTLQDSTSEGNTAIGHFSQYKNTSGNDNTSIGYSSMRENTGGNRNTFIGYEAGNKIFNADDNVVAGVSAAHDETAEFKRNTIIGNYACKQTAGTMNTNICLGYHANGKFSETDDSDALFIGSDNTYDPDKNITTSSYTPLITGHTSQSLIKYHDKEVNFNTRMLNIKPFDGSLTMFNFTTNKGDSGYDSGSKILKNRTTAIYYSQGIGNLFTGIETESDNDNPEILKFNLRSYNSKNPELNVNEGKLKLQFKDNGTNKPDVYIASDNKFSLNKQNTTAKLSETGLELKNKHNTEPTVLRSDNDMLFSAEEGNLALSGKKITALTENGNIVFKAQNDGVYITPGFNVNNVFAFNNSTPSLSTSNFLLRGNSNGYIEANSIILRRINASIPNELSSIYWTAYWRCRYCSSDIRLKNVTGDNTAGLEEINKLSVKNFTFKNDPKKEPHTGVIAQDLQKVFPNSVTKDKDGYLRIKTEEMLYAAVNAVKQLYNNFKSLSAKITGTEKRVQKLKKENEQLKKRNAELEKRFQKLEAKQNNKKK